MFYGLPPEKVPKLQAALDSLRELYPQDVLATDMMILIWRNAMFQRDPRFMGAMRSVAQTDQERSLVWRLHVLAWAATCALRVPGDFVECGVLRGFSSAVLCKYLEFENVPKSFYLYDTFSGPAQQFSTPEERRKWSRHEHLQNPVQLVERVRQTFAPYPNVKIVQGAVPNSFSQAIPEKIAYLHLDMNSAQAEIGALEHLYDRVTPGGMILLDDFGWVCNLDQTLAEMRFLAVRNQPILELPTGQGLILKGPGAA